MGTCSASTKDAPGLKRRLAGHLHLIEEYQDLPADVRVNPQHRRVYLDACQKVTDLLEKRRAEEIARTRKDEAESALVELMRTPGEKRRIAEGLS